MIQSLQLRRLIFMIHAALCFILFTVASHASPYDSNLPPAPNRYFTDKAHVVDSGTAEAINSQLENFERETSNQILVAIYNQLPEGEEIAQYSINTFNAWKVGQKGRDNGAVLFIFIQSRKMFICTGRGLEGALPDALCKTIITQEIAPRFRSGDYAGGIRAGVNGILAATRGEYKGSGVTVAEGSYHSQGNSFVAVWFLAFLSIIILGTVLSIVQSCSPTIYTRRGIQNNSSWYGGGWSSGGGSSGGFSGGGFSGGGGGSAGGGAGGSW